MTLLRMSHLCEVLVAGCSKPYVTVSLPVPLIIIMLQLMLQSPCSSAGNTHFTTYVTVSMQFR